VGNLTLRVGLISGSEINTNREGEDNVRLLQVQVTDSDDVQTVEQIRGSGDDQNPQDDSAVIVADLGPAWKIALGIDDGVDPGTIAKGERKIYSYDANRVIQAFIHWLVDGTIHINGDADTAVGFTDLKSGFDTLKSEVDSNLTALVTTVNAMVTAFNVPPAGTPMVTAPGYVPYVKTPLTGSVDSSEKATVKLP